MGGKVSSPKYHHTHHQCGGGVLHSGSRGGGGGVVGGAVVLENNYALKEDITDRPVYVMGYVNTFAVENYQSNDTEEGLPSENYEEDEVFTNNSRIQSTDQSCFCGSSDNNSSTYLLIDRPAHNTNSSQSMVCERISQENSLVLKNNVYNVNHLKALKSHLYNNNNVHLSDRSEHCALMYDNCGHANTLHEDISKLNISNEEYHHRTSRST